LVRTQWLSTIRQPTSSQCGCPGSEPFDPALLANVYPYQKNPDVVTSLEFERLLSASGPTMGHLVRPSDGKEPKKVAWLQCVGSRDINRSGNGYCSSVCCMYAIKDAMIAKDHAHGDLDCAIFYMDIRTFGKDYEKYYTRAKETAGVRFINARVHSVDAAGPGNPLRLRRRLGGSTARTVLVIYAAGVALGAIGLLVMVLDPMATVAVTAVVGGLVIAALVWLARVPMGA